MSEQEQNFYQRELNTLAYFSVNGKGDIFLKFTRPDFIMEFHPGDYYYDAFLRWCRAYKRRLDNMVDIDMPIVEDEGDGQ